MQILQDGTEGGQGRTSVRGSAEGAADLFNFTVGYSIQTISYVDQMVLGQLVVPLRDKQIMREILEEAAIKGIKTSKLVLCLVKQLVQV